MNISDLISDPLTVPHCLLQAQITSCLDHDKSLLTPMLLPATLYAITELFLSWKPVSITPLLKIQQWFLAHILAPASLSRLISWLSWHSSLAQRRRNHSESLKFISMFCVCSFTQALVSSHAPLFTFLIILWNSRPILQKAFSGLCLPILIGSPCYIHESPCAPLCVLRQLTTQTFFMLYLCVTFLLAGS